MKNLRKTGTWCFLSRIFCSHTFLSPWCPFADFSCVALSFKQWTSQLKTGSVGSPSLSSHACVLDLSPPGPEQYEAHQPYSPTKRWQAMPSVLGVRESASCWDFNLYPASHSHSDLGQILFTSLRLSFHIWKAEIIATCLLGASGKA